jgi:hypothetical protein
MKIEVPLDDRVLSFKHDIICEDHRMTVKLDLFR